ncbi:MAG: inositol monophosphatase family protein, partial [Brevundimonas sp.]|nr:inositol monophosphatase family protein [Brevundimonas sp.]
GAYLNDARIRVTGRRDLSQCLIGTGLPFMGKTGHAQAIKDIHAMGQRVAGIRRLGSAALDLAWVAAGRYDAFWERNLKPWDVAAGLLIVTEAGGKATTIDGTGNVHDGQQILVANSDLHPQIAAILRAT